MTRIKPRRKLVLDKETLTKLTSEEMSAINGGVSGLVCITETISLARCFTVITFTIETEFCPCTKGKGQTCA